MRLWSLHPRYLDRQGLLAVWREGLLAKAVIAGNTIGYTRHPQLQRFRDHSSPGLAINSYLSAIFAEAVDRGYRFDRSKINATLAMADPVPVTVGQVALERRHLFGKLAVRDPGRLISLADIELGVHPLFFIVEGPPEPWERAEV